MRSLERSPRQTLRDLELDREDPQVHMSPEERRIEEAAWPRVTVRKGEPLRDVPGFEVEKFWRR